MRNINELHSSVGLLPEQDLVKLKGYVPLRFCHIGESLCEGELLSFKYLVILGAPGSGKTMFMKHLLANMDRKKIILLIINVREYDFPENGLFQYLLSRYKLTLDEFTLLRSSGILLLVDGIDEAKNRWFRQELNRKIYNFVRQYPDIHIWCTSRSVGYEEAALGEPFLQVEILPLADEQIKEYIQYWYRERVHIPSERDERISAFLTALEAKENLKILGQNPLTLSLLAVAHRGLIRLPETQTELYAALIRTFFEACQLSNYQGVRKDNAPERTFVRRMAYLAQRMMCQAKFLINKTEIEEILSEVIKLGNEYRGGGEEAKEEAAGYAAYITRQDGILTAETDGFFSFPHRSFQEYLAAEFLFRVFLRKWDAFFQKLEKKVYDPLWEKALKFFVEMLGLNDGTDLESLAEGALQRQPLPVLFLNQILERPEIQEATRSMIMSALQSSTK